MRRCAPSATTSRRCSRTVTQAGQRRAGGGRGHHPGRRRCWSITSTCASTAPGEADPLFQRILQHAAAAQRRAAAATRAYEDIKNDLQRTAATYGYLDAQADPQRAGRRSAQPQGEHRARARDRRALSLRQDDASSRRWSARAWCAATCATTRASRSISRRCCARSSRWMTRSTSPTSRCCPASPTAATHTVPVNIQRRRQPPPPLLGRRAATPPTPGVRGTLGFEDRRINSRGHSFSVEVQAAQVTKYSLQTRYTIPIGDPAVENFTPARHRRAARLGRCDHQHPVGGTGRHGGHRQLAARVAASTRCAPPARQHRSRGPRVADRSPAGAGAGHRLGAQGLPGRAAVRAPAVHRDPRLAQPRSARIPTSSRCTSRPSACSTSRRKWHLLLRGELGATLVSEFSQLPTVFRFFAGGDNSVRGFALQRPLAHAADHVCRSDPPTS